MGMALSVVVPVRIELGTKRQPPELGGQKVVQDEASSEGLGGLYMIRTGGILDRVRIECSAS